jgi:hypothetical protein
MRLYHFTHLAALVGVDGMSAIRDNTVAYDNIDIYDYASPTSILRSGLRPQSTDDYDHYLLKPLPECVWLTNDPEMSNLYTNGHAAPDRGKWRVAVVIPEADRRLKHFHAYLEKNACRDVILYNAALDDGRIISGKQSAQAVRSFYVYFGDIGLDRIRAVDCVIKDDELAIAA